MNKEQQLIWNYLIQNALGKNNAKAISEIAKAIGVPPKGTNNDDVRGWLKDMVIHYGKPIGTLTTGAFIILNDTEREDAAQFVERENRADAVRKNGNNTG
ncbi:MAG: hypothetical protein SFU87_12415 [Chitinophagaceae bacterium]|nr:hypothetical protein [Chitinophagaceae bacterium]